MSMPMPMLKLNQYPLSVKVLLALALIRSVSYFALLPFLPIYLNSILGIDMAQVGYVLGLCLTVGTLTSVYGGYLADKMNKVRLMIAIDIGLIVLYLGLPSLNQGWMVIAVLVLLYAGSASLSVVGNALLSEQLPQEILARALSLRYTLQNIGAAIGPFLGAWMMHYYADAPFLVAAAFTVVNILLLLAFQRAFVCGSPLKKQSTEQIGFSETLTVLGKDQRLMFFTLGGIFSMIVYGPLLVYLAQYLVVVKSAEVAYETVAYVSAVNAAVVMSLQYIFGSWIKEERLLAWVSVGSAAFVLGLFGLSMSTELWWWMLAIIVFTLGEIIIVPAEFMFIDKIAPDNLRGSYFGVQNLVFIGVALGPVVCGFLLKYTAPTVMFYVLMMMAILGWLFYFTGDRRTGTQAGGQNVRVGRG